MATDLHLLNGGVAIHGAPVRDPVVSVDAYLRAVLGFVCYTTT